MTFLLIIHSLICVLLLLAILMQAGRGGGLTEQFASAETVFGAQTNQFMVRTTSVLATIFFTTCLLLAFMSARQERSLMAERSVKHMSGSPVTIPKAATPASPKTNAAATASEPVTPASDAQTPVTTNAQ
jgi:preprotein translocase subunit SecG